MSFSYLGGVITQTGADKMTVPELGERVVQIDNLVKSVIEALKENEMDNEAKIKKLEAQLKAGYKLLDAIADYAHEDAEFQANLLADIKRIKVMGE